MLKRKQSQLKANLQQKPSNNSAKASQLNSAKNQLARLPQVLSRKSSQSSVVANGRGIWLYGKHPVFLALQKKRREIFEIIATKNSVNELEKFLQEKNLHNYAAKIKLVDGHFIDAIIGEGQIHQGLALNCSALPSKSQNNLLDELEKIKQRGEKLPTLLIMDQLRDPHNVGAIIRSACAFGVDKIIFPEHNFPKESAVINKTSSGMIENVDLFLVVNLSNLMAKLKELGYWCIGLAGEATELVDKIQEYKNIALVVGSEGEGIRDLVKKNCDLLMKISISDKVESLNASVAASIALREIAR